MSATRMAKRHPKSPVEELLTSRKDVIAFASFLRTDPAFCMEVVKTVETIRHDEAIAAVWKKRQAWHPIRKWLHKNLWLRFR